MFTAEPSPLLQQVESTRALRSTEVWAGEKFFRLVNLTERAAPDHPWVTTVDVVEVSPTDASSTRWFSLGSGYN